MARRLHSEPKNTEEAIGTLRFAQRAKTVQAVVVKNLFDHVSVEELVPFPFAEFENRNAHPARTVLTPAVILSLGALQGAQNT